MMECTDRHFRFLLRLISRRTRLYTEMVTANALVHSARAGRDPMRFLAHHADEHPVALQLGGSDPMLMAEAAVMGAKAGFDEINLNIGCPSDRVTTGKFGACLMAEPDLVATCVRAIREALSKVGSAIPVTVKTRIGIDDQDSDAFLDDFVGRVTHAGCDTFIIHARKAILAGLSPKENREIFPYFILHEMPPGLRGLVIAGVLATAMGSLSTALNALATSFSKDFLFRGREESLSERRRVKTLRWSTVCFAVLIILVGVWTSYYASMHPEVRIIPLVLGILGYTFGSLLGVFLVAIFTRSRGHDTGNIIAMLCGFAAVLIMSIKEIQLGMGLTRIDHTTGKLVPALIIAFPWRITLGTLVTIAVALCFRTPAAKQQEMRDVIPAA